MVRKHVQLSFMHRQQTLIIIVFIVSTFALNTALADLTLSAPPRETPEAGEKVYKPLADYLTKVLGEKVVYEHPINWKNYETKMKKDEYDIVFDGPHFAAWRIAALSARPLVKLPGELNFVLIVKHTDFDNLKPRNLVGKRVCTLPSPNLGALTLFSMFPHPARQPDYVIIKGGFPDVAEALEQDRCDGAILRAKYYDKKASKEFRKSTRVVKRSKGYTNQGITVSSRIPPAYDKLLINSLTVGDGQNAAKNLFKRFVGKSGRFIRAEKKEYESENLLVDNAIFGWE